jgi:ribokinase
MGSVFVAGSLNMDVVAFASRLPAAGETIAGSRIAFFPGGKGLNAAVASARQGARTFLLGKVGDDAFGEQLLDFLKGSGVEISHVEKVSGSSSGVAQITVAEGGQNTIVVVPGANADVHAEHVLEPDIGPEDVLLAPFEIPLPAVRSFLEKGRLVGAKTVLCPTPAQPCDFMDLASVVMLNEVELAYYAGQKVSEAAGLAKSLLHGPHQAIVVTLGSAGALAVSEAGTIRVGGMKVSAVDAVGAGDCFAGCLAARFAKGDELETAMRYANAAAALSVTREGAATSMPTQDEVWDALAKG